MPEQKPKEQNPLAWLIGMKETAEQKKAREDRENRDKRAAEAVANAVRGIGTVKKVVSEAKDKAKK